MARLIGPSRQSAPDVTVRAFDGRDWPHIQRIYQQGIDTGQATFETEAPADWATFDAKCLPVARLAAVVAGQFAGWVALAPVSKRPVYNGVAEFSIYIAPECRGQGIGAHLMHALVDAAEEHGIWTLQASTFPENRESLGLQRKFGFRVIGRRERVARHYGVWRDTVLTERRSRKVGR
ncbi:MAG: N-acetyltransferase family protein [Pseudomonadota bacterium]